MIVFLALDAVLCRYMSHTPVLPHVLGLAFTMCSVAAAGLFVSRGDAGRKR